MASPHEDLRYLVQGFEKTVRHAFTREPTLASFLSRWASGLPASPGGIIDLAAGQGFEASILVNQGYRVIAQDASIAMTADSILPPEFTRVGDAANLPDGDDNFSGAILKDSMVYFSPWQRTQMLQEVRRTLVVGGQFLVISQRLNYDFADLSKIVEGKKYIVEKPREENETVDEWLKRLNQIIEDDGRVLEGICYRSNPYEFAALAIEAGLRLTKSQEFDRDDPISLESRWGQGRTSYFLQIFEK